MNERYDLAVLGSPVAHSLSPVMHEAGLAALGLAGSYVAIEVGADGMTIQARRVRTGELCGANITMPHKRIAAHLADVLMPSAARAGSVNTWYMEGGALFGESTDVAGVRAVMARRELPTEVVLILGSGGAAAAALVACDGYRVALSARSDAKAAALAAEVEVDVEIVPWGSGVGGATVLNATPIGMVGDSLPDGLVEAAGALFDMTYGSGPSPALLAARDAGLPTADGIDLLTAQAAESFRIWTGEIPPAGLFERIARNVSRTPPTPPIQGVSE